MLILFQTMMSTKMAMDAVAITTVAFQVKVAFDFTRGSFGVVKAIGSDIRKSLGPPVSISVLQEHIRKTRPRRRIATPQIPSPMVSSPPPPSLFTAAAIVSTALVLLALVVWFMRDARRMRLQKIAAVKLQSLGRAWRASIVYRVQRAAILKLQSAIRTRGAVLAAAATTVQSQMRCCLARNAFYAAVGAAVLIQADVRRWRTYWMALAAIDARHLVRGELGTGTGLRRRRLAVERLDAATRKLDAATRADAVSLISRVTRGHLARLASRSKVRQTKVSSAKRASGDNRGTVKGARRAKSRRSTSVEISPMHPRAIEFPGTAEGKGKNTLTARELLDEIKRECATLFELKKSSSLDLSTAVLPSSLATTTAPPSPPPRSRFSNAGIAKLSPPSPSSSEKRRGSAMNSVMGELKGRLAIRRSQVVGKATPTAHLFI